MRLIIATKFSNHRDRELFSEESIVVWKTVGQSTAIKRISNALNFKRLSHAYLICGIDGVGKLTFALDIAKLANCLDMGKTLEPCGSCNQCHRIDSYNHTDVQVYDVKKDTEDASRSSTMVTLEQLREDFLKQVHRKPYEGRKRVFIIASVETMRSEQSNILLKTLEEPPEDVMIILLAKDPNNLLATIVSRCQLLTLEPVSELDIQRYLVSCGLAADVPIEEIAKLSRGRPEWAYKAATNPDILESVKTDIDLFIECLTSGLDQKFNLSRNLSSKFLRDRESVYEFFDIALTWIRDVLLFIHERPSDIINISRKDQIGEFSEILKTEDILKLLKLVRITTDNLRKNVSSSLVLDNLMLKLPTVNSSV